MTAARVLRSLAAEGAAVWRDGRSMPGQAPSAAELARYVAEHLLLRELLELLGAQLVAPVVQDWLRAREWLSGRNPFDANAASWERYRDRAFGVTEDAVSRAGPNGPPAAGVLPGSGETGPPEAVALDSDPAPEYNVGATCAHTEYRQHPSRAGGSARRSGHTSSAAERQGATPAALSLPGVELVACACGCGFTFRRRTTGRKRLYYSDACRRRAQRSRASRDGQR